MATTFNNITEGISIKDNDYLVGYRDTSSPKKEIQITPANIASYINTNYTYTSASNTNQFIGPQPDLINMNKNEIVSCVNGLKAWVNFNGIMGLNGLVQGSGTISGSPDTATVGVSSTTTSPLLGGTVYVYPITVTHTNIGTLLPRYAEIYVNYSTNTDGTRNYNLSGFYQIQSINTHSFVFNYISNSMSTIQKPASITWSNRPIMSSYNVSSISYNGGTKGGYYTINFNPNTFSSGNYACMGGSLATGSNSLNLAGLASAVTTKNSSAVQIAWNTGGNGDTSMVFFAAVGN